MRAQGNQHQLEVIVFQIFIKNIKSLNIIEKFFFCNFNHFLQEVKVFDIFTKVNTRA